MKQMTNTSILIVSVVFLLLFTILSCEILENTYTLTILASKNGTTYPSGTEKVMRNVELYISAIPAQGYSFKSWEVVSGKGVVFGDEQSAETTVVLTEGDASIKANFVPEQCFLTLMVNGNGTTLPEPDIRFAGTFNEPIHIEAFPFEDWVFVNWEVTSGICNFTNTYAAETTVCLLSEEAVIRANFVLGNYTLTVEHAGNGTTKPEGEILSAHGVPVAINAIPDTDWVFHSWEIISGTGCSFGNIYHADTTVTLTAGNVTIRANFRDAQAPGAYTVAIDQDFIDENNETALSFTYDGAEAGGIYHYFIDDQANTSTLQVTGSGTIGQGTDTITGINVSSLDDGILILSFYVTDPSGNDGDKVYDTVLKDTTAPSFLSVSHSGSDNYYRAGETITFTVNMGESGLLVTANLSVLDNSFNSEQEFPNTSGNTYTYTTPPLGSNTMREGTGISITIEASDGAHSVADNFLSLTLDKTPPAGSFIISSTADVMNEYTLERSVALNMSISGAVQMRFGNSPAERDAASWESYSANKPWTLAVGVGTTTVYGEFRDTAGNTFPCNDSIFFIKKLIPADGTGNDTFGRSVSVSSPGNIVAVGADGDDSTRGAAYMFHGLTWGTETKLTYTEGAAGDYLGRSIALSSDGSTTVAGAYGDDSLEGSLLIYYSQNWGTTRRHILDLRTQGDLLGYSVAVSGNGSIVAAGAPGVNVGIGAAFVYSGGAPSWGTDFTLTPSNGAEGDNFGQSIAISADGSTIVIGAPGSASYKGSVYVYNGINWTQVKMLTATDGAAGDNFGHSVAVSGDGNTIVVGAYGRNSNTGIIYVYSGQEWGTVSMIEAPDKATADYFGSCVSVSADGNIIAVGAYGDDDKGALSGSAYVFSEPNWTTKTKHTACDGAMLDNFGISVAVSADGSTIVVGATGDDDNGSNSGSVYVLPALESLQ